MPRSPNNPINFHKFIDNKWTILFPHSEDYPRVCTTLADLIETARPIKPVQTRLKDLL
jgi:alkyl hydroperoxide reductase subunit AhpC